MKLNNSTTSASGNGQDKEEDHFNQSFSQTQTLTQVHLKEALSTPNKDSHSQLPLDEFHPEQT